MFFSVLPHSQQQVKLSTNLERRSSGHPLALRQTTRRVAFSILILSLVSDIRAVEKYLHFSTLEALTTLARSSVCVVASLSVRSKLARERKKHLRDPNHGTGHLEHIQQECAIQEKEAFAKEGNASVSNDTPQSVRRKVETKRHCETSHFSWRVCGEKPRLHELLKASAALAYPGMCYILGSSNGQFLRLFWFSFHFWPQTVAIFRNIPGAAKHPQKPAKTAAKAHQAATKKRKYGSSWR